jgi:hypothetical protein
MFVPLFVVNVVFTRTLACPTKSLDKQGFIAQCTRRHFGTRLVFWIIQAIGSDYLTWVENPLALAGKGIFLRGDHLA